MTGQGVVVGLDVSTTATKAVVMAGDGAILAVAASEYGCDTPRPLWSEQDPELWWTATQEVVPRALADAGVEDGDVAAVGLTGQMHGLVLLDDANEVIRPAILWNDQRTGPECDEIRRLVGRERFIAITGNDALTGFTAPKIVWVQRHEPEAWARARHILVPKDFVRLRLTGEHALDKADGSGTILFDLAARTWSAEVTEALGIGQGLLPPTFEGPAVTGRVTEAAAAVTGLRAGTPVVGGGGDQSANAVGVGAVLPGIAALSVGTSGVVFVPVLEPVVEANGLLQAFCHAVPGRWHVMGVVQSAAGSLRWFRDAIAPGVQFDALVEEADAVPPGAEGLVFLPYISGERTPHPDPLARGAFVGLTVRHGRGHMVRAVLEGVAFALRDVFGLVSAVSPAPVTELRASGGGTRSALWRGILADVLGASVATMASSEGAAAGAAILAAVGAGWYPSVDAATDAVVRVEGRTDAANPGAYDAAYDVYRSLYGTLAPTNRRLAEV
jgi:xylulokinase